MDYEDISRLKKRYEDAGAKLSRTATEFNQAQIEGAAGRTQYFEKLAIGSGAAIAAIVSFLGTHASTLRPHWALRCSLLCLATAMIAALYRNFRHPNYLFTVRRRLWMEASREQQQFKHQFMMAVPDVIDLDDGKSINKDQCQLEFEKSDSGLQTLVEKLAKNEESLATEWSYAERICLGSLSLAMISLVWLALCSF